MFTMNGRLLCSFLFCFFLTIYGQTVNPKNPTKCQTIKDPWQDGVINGAEAKIRVNELGTDFASMKVIEEMNRAKIKTSADYLNVDLRMKNIAIADIRFSNFTRKFSQFIVGYSYTGGQVTITSDAQQTVRVPANAGGPRTDLMQGQMQITTTNATMETEGGISVVAGLPVARLGSCIVKLNDLQFAMTPNITMTSAQEKAVLYYVKITFENAICNFLRNMVTFTINRQLRTYPSKVKLDDNGLTLDYTMLSKSPEEMKAMVDESTFERFIRAVVYYKTPTSSLKFSPPPLFDVKTKNAMFEYWLSDFALNTLSYAAHEQKYLSSLTAVPKFASVKNAKLLRISCPTNELCMGSIFNSNRKFGNNAYVNVTFSATDYPKSAFNTTDSYWIGAGMVQISVIENENVTTPVLKANAPCIYGTLTPKLALNTLYATTSVTSLSLVVLESPLKTLSDDDMNKLRSIVSAILEELMNGYLSVGFKLPLIEGITLVNPKLQTYPRTIYVASNFTYAGKEDDILKPRIGK